MHRRVLVMIFEKPSLRTRVSAEAVRLPFDTS